MVEEIMDMSTGQAIKSIESGKKSKTQRIIRVVSLCAFVAILGVFGACSPAAESESEGTLSFETEIDSSLNEGLPYTFTDDLGNEVQVKSVEKVIACMGSFANIWELAGGSLVGASSDALEDYELISQEVASVGDFTAPNLEQIIALEPDLVLMTGASTGKDGAASQVDLKESLEASGITVAYFNVTVFDDYLRMLETCCDITGRTDLFAENGTAVAERIEKIKAQPVPESEVPTVLLMTTYSGGTRVQNSSTMTGAMLADLGVQNLADENKSLLKDFSLESVIEMNPDYLLVVPMGNDDEVAMKNLKEATEANPAWATLDAVQNGNYITLDKKLFLYKPNSSWDEAYAFLFDTLYRPRAE